MKDREIESARGKDLLSIVQELEIPCVLASDHVKIHCPFTEEKTPSFSVYSDHVHCYSCGYHNDGIGFVVDRYKVTFKEAVEMLNSI